MKWPRLIRLSFYFESFMEVIVAILPTEINQSRDVNYTCFGIYVNFMLCYFDPVANIIGASLALVPVFVKRAVFHLEPATDLAINFAFVFVWQCMNLWFIHLVYVKFGMIYIEAEVLREGNN